MTEYLSPDVNVESVASVTKTTVTTSKSTGGMIGILPRGITTKPVLVTSWLDAVRKFALGLDTPFMANSDLIYALYGFFQNGGKQVYLKRVVGTGAMKASLGVPDTTPTVTFSAIDEGDWGNQLSLVIVANAEDNTLFDVSVLYKDIQVESFSGLSNTATSDQYFVDIINQNSNYINVPSGTLSATAKKSFTGGKDDLGTITDTTYTDALKTFDFISDVRILAIPGQVSTVVSKALQDYVNGRTDTIIPLFDGPKSADVSAIKTFRKNLDCKGGLYYPWIKVSDPLSKAGTLRDCPTVGHIMGIVARTIESYGSWKAPAGINANIVGAMGLVKELTKADCDLLNPVGVNAIISKPNYGIVVWGARTVSSDDSYRYMSDVQLDAYIKNSIFDMTQWVVFEPQGDTLWTKVTTMVTDFMNSLYLAGALKGSKPEEAYFVKCDGDLNTDAVVNSGQLICQVGYAGKKPAEFVIFRVSHTMNS